MAIRIISQVWETGPAGQSECFVLLALADYANDEGECWPSIEGIARKCRLSERGVRKILRRLEEDGWITTEVGGGRHGCNKYIVNPEPRSPLSTVSPRNGSAENPDAECRKPGTTFPPEPRSPGTGVQKTRNLSAENPEPGSPEPSLTIIEPSIRARARESRFEEFWSVYPHRHGVKRNRNGAEQKFRLAVKRGVPEQTIIDGARRYAKDKRVLDGYARDPTTWLNQEGWTDDIEPSSPSAGGYDPQLDRWRYIAEHGTSEGWRARKAAHRQAQSL